MEPEGARTSAGTLRLVPEAWYSWNFEVLREGERITRIVQARFRERGEFELDGTTYRVRKVGLFRPDHILERGERRLATASRTSPLGGRLVIRTPDRRLTLSRRWALVRAHELRHGDRPVGSVVPDSAFRRSATARLPEELPLSIRIFIAYLVLAAWKRRAAAAAASG